MRNVSLLNIVDDKLAVIFNFEVSIMQVKPFSDCESANGKQDSVILFNFFLSILVVGDLNRSYIFWLLKLNWSSSINELCVVFLHKQAYSVGHLLVKSSKQNRSNHYCCIIAKSSKKACTLQCNIGSSNN